MAGNFFKPLIHIIKKAIFSPLSFYPSFYPSLIRDPKTVVSSCYALAKEKDAPPCSLAEVPMLAFLGAYPYDPSKKGS